MLEQESLNSTFSLPISIFFNDNLSSLETITKFLREEKNLRYSEIAKILGRDERTIWCTYSNSKKKMEGKLDTTDSEISIPISTIKSRELSVLETITEYLKEELSMKFTRIAEVMKRDYRTIWTVYRRAKAKRRENAAA